MRPTNWNVRPAGPNAQSIGGDFLSAVDQAPKEGRQICGVRVPSLISTTECNLLLDPRQGKKYRVIERGLYSLQLAGGDNMASPVGIQLPLNRLDLIENSSV